MARRTRTASAQWMASCEADNLPQEVFGEKVFYERRKMTKYRSSNFRKKKWSFQYFPRGLWTAPQIYFWTHWNKKKEFICFFANKYVSLPFLFQFGNFLADFFFSVYWTWTSYSKIWGRLLWASFFTTFNFEKSKNSMNLSCWAGAVTVLHTLHNLLTSMVYFWKPYFVLKTFVPLYQFSFWASKRTKREYNVVLLWPPFETGVCLGVGK